MLGWLHGMCFSELSVFSEKVGTIAGNTCRHWSRGSLYSVHDSRCVRRYGVKILETVFLTQPSSWGPLGWPNSPVMSTAVGVWVGGNGRAGPHITHVHCWGLGVPQFLYNMVFSGRRTLNWRIPQYTHYKLRHSTRAHITVNATNGHTPH